VPVLNFEAGQLVRPFIVSDNPTLSTTPEKPASAMV
jgi:hypothetical protein